MLQQKTVRAETSVGILLEEGPPSRPLSTSYSPLTACTFKHVKAHPQPLVG